MDKKGLAYQAIPPAKKKKKMSQRRGPQYKKSSVYEERKGQGNEDWPTPITYREKKNLKVEKRAIGSRESVYSLIVHGGVGDNRREWEESDRKDRNLPNEDMELSGPLKLPIEAFMMAGNVGSEGGDWKTIVFG